MALGQALAAELRYEAVSTRKHLERVSATDFGWRPHEKCFPMGRYLRLRGIPVPAVYGPSADETED